ncbi:hypothetical protein [Nocardioides sp. GXQ0305]|uniref:hypothetical protein n=1 Tax=Nocardioides sp. GXQ0305 TaxID=3423912 RepID=UPI003D7E465B
MPRRDSPLPIVAISVALGAASLGAAAGTLLLPGLLTGTPAMNGSARGTAAVVLLVAVPLLAWAVTRARRGSDRAYAVWLGVTAYLLYNAVLFCFATPFNDLFLVYVAMLSLSLACLVGLLPGALEPPGPDPGATGRWVAVFIAAATGLNTLAWLRVVVPALLDDEPAAFLRETGLTTNPVYVQDLALWLPAMLLLAIGLFRNGPRHLLLAAGGLVFWVVEAVGVGVDQWMGGRADPGSSVASADLAPAFLLLAVICSVAAAALLRRLPSGPSATATGPSAARTSGAEV